MNPRVLSSVVSDFFRKQGIFLAVLLLAAGIPAQLLAQVPFVNQPLSPSAAAPGSAAFTLTLTGTGFAANAVVNWNGSARTTTFVSSSKLQAAILATDIAVAGTARVTVSNPTSGATSAAVLFPIAKPFSLVSLLRNDMGAGSQPQALIAADFNGDGKQDIAVANGAGNSASIYLGNGDGTFQAPANYTTAHGFPDAIIAGDFNGDGKLDLALVLQRSNQISILLGNGDGTFGTHQEFSTGTNPIAAATADVNGDGKLDLIVANFNDNTVSVLIGNGDGTFQSPATYSTGVNPEGVAVGDFNGDGFLDLAVPNNNDNTVSILLNNGAGAFPTHTDLATAPGPTFAAIGDFNNDGKLDIAVSTISRKASVLIGNGDGTFAAHKDYATGGNSQMVVAADLNNDNKLDLAVVNYSDNNVTIIAGNGDGTFKAQQDFPTGAGPGWLAVGDFNGDGKMDLGVIDTTSAFVSVLNSTGLSVTPTLLTWTNQEGGVTSTTQTVTLKNATTSAIALTQPFTIVGPNAGDFAQTNTCGTSLAAGGTCTISNTFTPQNLGVRLAEVIIPLANGSSTGYSFFGQAKIDITLGPTRNFTYKPQLLNTTSKPMNFKLTNVSGLTIAISSILINGHNPTDFNIASGTTCPTSNGTLGPGASCNIAVTYSPTITGGESAALNVFGQFTPGSGQQAVLLFGTGTAVSVTPTSLTFAAQTVGTTSAGKNVTFKNVGTTAMSVTVSIQGTNLKDFAQTNNCNGSVAAGGSCTITVTFTPTATGTRSATLNIGDPDPTGPQIVTLSGTGQ